MKKIYYWLFLTYNCFANNYDINNNCCPSGDITIFIRESKWELSDKVGEYRHAGEFEEANGPNYQECLGLGSKKWYVYSAERKTVEKKDY